MSILKAKSAPNIQTSICDRILIFDLSIGGHHPGYILHLIQYWHERQLPGYLYIVVLPEFMTQHGDVVDVVNQYSQSKIKFVPISQQERNNLAPRSHFISRKKLNFQEWNLLCKYAKLLNATQALVMYFDTYQLPILLRRNPPCPVSAIYFRPKFHYQNFSDNYLSWQERWHQKREQLYLSLVLNNQNLATLFCLDPLAIEHINAIGKSQKALYLPDPVKTYQLSPVDKIKQLRLQLGIEQHRKIYLSFGDLNQRKGIHQTLQAVSVIPQRLANKVCLLFVGLMSGENYQRFLAAREKLCQSLPVQIIHLNQYITESDIQQYFELSDVILALYQRHVGMSGILNRAAAVQKPVLTADYGLMGAITRRYKLGLTVDSTKPRCIAKGLTELLTNRSDRFCDSSSMQQFAAKNTPQKFANTIFDQILNYKPFKSS